MRELAWLTAVAAATAMFVTPRAAEACGACFAPPSENTVVTGHRMAMSISKDETVLWDQIQYSGDPADFAWVLPVKGDAELGIATDAWFDVLDAATSTTVAPAQCFGDGGEWGGGDDSFDCSPGCASSDAAMAGDAAENGGPPPDPVEVLHQGTAGPYETVTLSTDEPGALNSWLEGHGYNVPDDMQPVIDAYVEEGFDFIALRLAPDQGTRAMRPVRVRTPGASFALPLRMVAGGTGAITAITLFVIGEGRYEAASFPNQLVDLSKLTFDFANASSNYGELRAETLASGEGDSWITTYARQDALLSRVADPLAATQPSGNGDVLYQLTGGIAAATIAEAYVRQGILNGEGEDDSCLPTLNGLAGSGLRVIASPCEGNAICVDGDGDAPGTISAHRLACDRMDDVAVALTGKTLRDVWVTRLEAALPRAALATDLELTAALDQSTVENRVSPPCPPGTTAAALLAPRRGKGIPGGLVALTLGGIAGLWWLRRRRSDALANR